MACFSATQLHTLLWTSSLNRTSHHFKPNYTYRTPKFLFRQKPLIASFSTSDIEARTETKDSSTATPRELCHGHVPEHVIRRVEEVGYVIPTEVQLLALPFLYSGRDCVLHAQAEPPTIVVATMGSLCQMLEKHILKLDSCQVLVVDEADVVHVHVNSVEPMPSCLHHRFVVCTKREKNQVLLSLLQVDSPESAIIFVSEQGTLIP